MYRHPVQEYAELELGGENGRLVVWLFGKKFTTLTTPLHQDQWHELCVTWSHEKDTPALYVDRNSVDVEAGGLNKKEKKNVSFALYSCVSVFS